MKHSSQNDENFVKLGILSSKRLKKNLYFPQNALVLNPFPLLS